MNSIAEDRPNIVWIVSEDNSPFIGAYGDEAARTPRIDGLAKSGVTFTKAYANAPVCAPSRSTLITGKYATSLGSEQMRSDVPLPEDFQQFPYYLKQAGYHTANRVKTDYNTPLKPGTWSRDDWWTMDQAFEGREENQPFFLMFNTWMTHEGRLGGRDDDDLKKQLVNSLESLAGLTDTAESEAAAIVDGISFDPDEMKLPAYHPDISEVRKDWAHYYKCIALMDYEVGLVLDDLERRGVMDNTIVFYFSDHGGVLPRSKRFLYESGLKVPLIVHVPEKYRALAQRLAAAQDDLTSFVDLAPTVLDIAGVEIPPHFDGRSLLQRGAASESRYSYAYRGRMDERYDMVRSVTDGRFRYSRNYYPYRKEGGHIRFMWKKMASVGAWEAHYEAGLCNEAQSAFWQPREYEVLFDLEADPDNVVNLAKDPDYAGDLERLSAALDRWSVETNDIGLIPEPMIARLRGAQSPWDWVRASEQPMEAILAAAKLAIAATAQDEVALVKLSKAEHPALRYWSALGLTNLASRSDTSLQTLQQLSQDDFDSVQAIAAEGLYRVGDTSGARAVFTQMLQRFEGWGELDETNYKYADYVLLMAMNAIQNEEADPLSVYPMLLDFAGKESAYPSWLVEGLKQ